MNKHKKYKAKNKEKIQAQNKALAKFKKPKK